MLKHRVVVLTFICTMMLSCWISAQEQEKAPKVTGVRGELLGQLADVGKKIVDLANAMPAETYSWRPMEGVRSVGEVYMHIGGSNYLFPSFVGSKMPEGVDENMEKSVIEKTKVVDFVKQSLDHFRQVLLDMKDEDLDKPAKMFGRETTGRNVLLTGIMHLHEHLGQSIAYARMNHIVPPWTAAEQAKQEAKDKK